MTWKIKQPQAQITHHQTLYVKLSKDTTLQNQSHSPASPKKTKEIKLEKKNIKNTIHKPNEPPQCWLRSAGQRFLQKEENRRSQWSHVVHQPAHQPFDHYIFNIFSWFLICRN